MCFFNLPFLVDKPVEVLLVILSVPCQVQQGDVLPASSSQPPRSPALPSREGQGGGALKQEGGRWMGWTRVVNITCISRVWPCTGNTQGAQIHTGKSSVSRRDETAPRTTCCWDDFSQDAVASPPLTASNSGEACSLEPRSAARPGLGTDAAQQHFWSCAIARSRRVTWKVLCRHRAIHGAGWTPGWMASSVCSPSLGCP